MARKGRKKPGGKKEAAGKGIALARRKEDRLDSAYSQRLAKLKSMERELSEKRAKEKHAFSVMQGMLKEREELHALHEKKVVELRQQYGKKLKSLDDREKQLELREIRVRDLESANKELLRERNRLEKEVGRYRTEAEIIRAAVAKHNEELQLVQREEAHTRTELHRVSSQLKRLQAQFDRAHSNAAEMDAAVKERNAERQRLQQELDKLARRHSEMAAELTHHSAREIKVSIRRAEEHIQRGLIAKAQNEYERIRKFYVHLPQKEKKKVYPAVAKLKERLTHHF
jgi:chromosome segregation ATPase